MTQTTDTAGTALAQVAPGVLAQAQGTRPWTVADLADKLAPPVKEIPAADPFPKPAKPVKLAAPLRAVLTALPKVFGRVSPTERRQLEAAELSQLTAEAIAIKAVTTPLGDRLRAISEIVRHHMDCVAEVRGLAGQDTPRVAEGVAKGHYLLAGPEHPFEIEVDDFDGTWQQRYVKGGTSQSQARLEALLADGTITRKEYLSFTHEVRVLDQENIAAAIRRDPARALQILGAITERSAPGASLYAPKQ